MAAMAIPLPDDHVEAWKAFARELHGPRAADFADFNARMGLNRHQAYLQQTPRGHLVVVVHDGPGGEEFLKRVAGSDHPFDSWFRQQISELHCIDYSQPAPPAPQLFINGGAS